MEALIPIQKIYDYYAPLYDYFADKLFRQGRIKAANIINKNAIYNANILEVGVGTGLSLPYYRSDLRIVGVDTSPKMLQKANSRIREQGLRNVCLLNMDAENLKFPDGFYHMVVAMHIISVVEHLELMLGELCRVCKIDGDVIILNHFSPRNQLLSILEKMGSIITPFLGFKLGMSLNKIRAYPKLKLIQIHKTSEFNLSTILHFKKIWYRNEKLE